MLKQIRIPFSIGSFLDSLMLVVGSINVLLFYGSDEASISMMWPQNIFLRSPDISH